MILPRVRVTPRQSATQTGLTPVVPVVTSVSVQPTVNAVASNIISVPRTGFPPYLLFAPNAVSQTVNADALTGVSLPGGSIGLIIQLNRDSARHFMGRTGTANISIPVATLSTLRFGIYGVNDRPRAEFNLKLRYVSAGGVLNGRAANTNVSGYGFTVGETGHGDVRMLVPTEARRLGQEVNGAGLTSPTNGDIALLEWPTTSDPSFRLSFLEKNSPISQQATALFEAALAAGQVVGHGACWLAAGIAPIW